MTFIEAKEKLEQIANGRPFALDYFCFCKPKHEGKKYESIDASVYIEGYGWHKAQSWKTALNILEDRMKEPVIDETETPND